MKKIQSKSLLCLDVCTRWNSTYLMLNTTQKLERAFERYGEVDPNFRVELGKEDGENGVPLEGDWGNIKMLVLFLEKNYELTLRISDSLYVTSNIFFMKLLRFYVFYILGNKIMIII